MSGLNPTTCRRLKKLPQIPSVWEGDRRPLQGFADGELDADGKGECILWVDWSEGVVRAMDLVSAEMGLEAVVRALLRAMEHPQSAKPARPSKIVVCDREIQFYLRGILQDLEIIIDYLPSLPLIDELFRGFEEMSGSRQPKLPPQYAKVLQKQADQLWQISPWKTLADHQILSIKLNQWDVETFYVSVMGMLGVEYGVLLYRSLDSLKRFRAAVVSEDSFKEMEQAFLGQDCLFLTFGRPDDHEDDQQDNIDLADFPTSEIVANFGTVHPMEGMRPFLYEEEAVAFYVALVALQRFFKACDQQLAADPLPLISKRYRIPLPSSVEGILSTTLKVETLPDLSAELLEMAEAEDDVAVPLRDDLIPKDACLSLGMMPWENVEKLRTGINCYQSKDVAVAGEGMPVVLIQTTRPKAKAIIEQIQTAGGLKGICFNPGEDPDDGDLYDLGILQTENSSLYLFGEFPEADPIHVAARQKWDQRCKKIKGYCGLIIAKGSTGASRGNPQPRDMMALFEARSLSARELGLGMLQLMRFELE